MKRLKRTQIATWLASRDVGRNRLLWRLVYACSPGVAGMVSTFSEAMRPENQVVWQAAPNSDEDAKHPDLESRIAGCVELVSEIINRAPAPMGLDGYLVFVTRLGRIAGDEDRLLPDWVDATLNARPALDVRLLQGDRWDDWKRGDGPQTLAAVLGQFQPEPDAPVTLIQVAVTGAGAIRTLRALEDL